MKRLRRVFDTGSSKTADVEKTLEYGVHGPKRLHIVLVNAWVGMKTL